MRERAFFSAFILLACALPAQSPALYRTPTPPSAASPGASPFILDPGHGGEDLGAVQNGAKEKDIALSIARKVRAKLERTGAVPVRLTRDSDSFIGLDQRVDQSLAWDGAAFISLHVNQVHRKNLQGITVYAFGPDRSQRRPRRHPRLLPLPAPPRAQARAGLALADAVARSLRAQGFRVGPPERADYYVLKNPRIPSILIELGYLSNAEEAARLSEPAYQERLAEALAVSLQSYLARYPAVAGR